MTDRDRTQTAEPPSAPAAPQGVPPQTAAAARAVAVRNESTSVEAAQGLAVTDMLAREDKSLERIETVVTVPPEFQYEIPIKGKKHPDGSWNNDTNKVGLTVDGYDYLNRVIGVSFFLPPKVQDREGELRYNPIIQRDYIRLRMAGVWYTPLGQAVMSTEDIEVDFGLMFVDKKANAKSAQIVTDDAGNMLWDDAGNPVIKLNHDDLLKCVRELTRNRAFGPRYAVTIGRVRILKMASGLRSLPLSQATAFRVRVVGYRDKMTPIERIAAAGGDLSTLYGGKNLDADPNLKPLSSEEQREAGLVGEEAADDEAVEASERERAQSGQPDQTEPRDVTPPNAAAANPVDPTAPWTADELNDVDLGATAPERE